MNPGVVAPDQQLGLDGVGDRPLNAVPPAGPCMGPSFPALPAEETILGATDPRSELDGKRRKSLRKFFE